MLDADTSETIEIDEFLVFLEVRVVRHSSYHGVTWYVSSTSVSCHVARVTVGLARVMACHGESWQRGSETIDRLPLRPTTNE